MSKDIKNVMPTPTGNKLLVTCKKRESSLTKTGLIIPEGAMNAELLDIQEVVAVGEYIKTQAVSGVSQFTLDVGDTIKIDWSNPSFFHKKTNDTYESNPNNPEVQNINRNTGVEFGVPMYTVAGIDVLEIDKSTIKLIWKKHTLED